MYRCTFVRGIFTIMAGMFGGGSMPVHAGSPGGLYGAATNFLGGIGKSIGNFFAPQAKAPSAPLVNTAQSYLQPQQQVSQSVGQVPATPPPLSSGTTTSNSYSPQTFEQNYAPVAQAESSLSSYLAGRDPSAYLTDQYSKLGIPDLQKAIGNQTSDILAQQNNLETLPKEDIARRGDTGMLTAAQRSRLTASEQAPIREQLLKSQQANAGDTSRLNSLLQLANNYLGAYNQGTQLGEQPYQQGIQKAQAGFSTAQNASDRVASEKSSTTQAEAMQNRQVQLAQNLTQEIRQGATLSQMMGKYLAQGLNPDTILSLYNAGSKYGPAKESATQLSSLYGVAAR